MEITDIGTSSSRNFITLDQFNSLSELDKLHYLITQCRKVAEGADGDQQSFLYHEEEFFVLVTFSAKTDELLKIQPLQFNKRPTWSMA